MSFRAVLAAVVGVVAVSGCLAPETEAPAVGSTHGEVLSMNALSMNALSMNALSMNALSMNALSMNALSMNGAGMVYELDSASGGDMQTTRSGLESLRYIARCALPEGDYLRVDINGQIVDLPGLLGLVPNWVDRGLLADEQKLMSACLLAHVNAFGVSVPISTRSEALPPAEGEETESFFYGDGAFYGNMFQSSPSMFACEIRARNYRPAGSDYSIAAASPDASSRVCADAATAADCKMQYTGYCDQVCNVIERDGNQWRFSDCLGKDGVRYQEVITVWLQGDHAESCNSALPGYTCEPSTTF